VLPEIITNINFLIASINEEYNVKTYIILKAHILKNIFIHIVVPARFLDDLIDVNEGTTRP
jgi:hypothetical protein